MANDGNEGRMGPLSYWLAVNWRQFLTLVLDSFSPTWGNGIQKFGGKVLKIQTAGDRMGQEAEPHPHQAAAILPLQTTGIAPLLNWQDGM